LLLWREAFLVEFVECDVRPLEREKDDRTDCVCSQIHLRKGRSVARQLAIIATPGSMADHTEMLVAFPVHIISNAGKISANGALTEEVFNL
jgi:hypothetical protein